MRERAYCCLHGVETNFELYSQYNELKVKNKIDVNCQILYTIQNEENYFFDIQGLCGMVRYKEKGI